MVARIEEVAVSRFERAAFFASLLSCLALLGAAPHDPASTSHDAIVLYDRGVEELGDSRWKDALADFTGALALDGSFESAFTGRGEARSRTHDNAGAIADFTAAIALDSKDEAVYVLRSNEYLGFERYQEALADADTAISLDGSDTGALEDRGRALYGLGRLSEARAAQRSVTALDPKGFRGFFYLGVTDLALCENTAAIADFGDAITIRDDSDSRNDRAIAYQRTHAWDSATADLDQAMQLDPASDAPYVNRAAGEIHAKQFNEAKVDLDIAIHLHPNAPEAYRNRALLRLRQKNYVLALGDINYSLQYAPDDPESYRVRAWVYDGLGRADLAALDRKMIPRKLHGKADCPNGL
jgi:tetratricopeptide (TPR) repeat protein